MHFRWVSICASPSKRVDRSSGHILSSIVWIVVVGLLLSFGSSNSSAQHPADDPLTPNDMSRMYLGLVGGYNRVYHSSGFQSVTGDVLCPDFTEGRADSYYIGISAEYLLRRFGSFTPSILAHVVYDNLPANYRVDGNRLPSVDENQNIVYSKVQHVAEIQYSLIDIDLLFKLDLFNSGFGITAGPVIGVPVSVRREQRMELVESLNATFDPALFPSGSVEYVDGGRGIITGRDDIPDHAGVRMAFKVGVQYDIPFGSMVVVPSVSYNIGLAKTSPSSNLRINALQMGMDLRFAL